MSNSHNSHNNKDHKSKDDVLSERSYVAAAHRDDRSEEDRQESLDKAKEIHLARTGSELKEDLEKKESRVAQPGLASTEEGRKERAHLAAAHRKDRDEEGKRESLEKASELHEERTGEPLSEIEEGTKEHSKDEHKKQPKSDGSHSDSSKKDSETNKGEHKASDDRVAQPGLAATEEGRRERAYIAAAHRDDRDEESKQASLEKASELHEERTGEPLAEAEELSKEASHKRKSKDGETEEKESGSSKQASPKKAKSSDKEGSGAKSSKSGEKSKSGDKKDDDHLERQERAHIAAAHRKGRDAEGRMESLAKASKIHEERTGEPLPEAVEKGAVEKPEDKFETPHKRHHDDKEDRSTDDSGDNRKASPKRQKTEEEEKPIIAGHVVEQPGLAASADGRKERAFIASAHNKTHTEESQLESLEKANELHEKRTGEALPEAVERGVAAQ